MPTGAGRQPRTISTIYDQGNASFPVQVRECAVASTMRFERLILGINRPSLYHQVLETTALLLRTTATDNDTSALYHAVLDVQRRLAVHSRHICSHQHHAPSTITTHQFINSSSIKTTINTSNQHSNNSIYTNQTSKSHPPSRCATTTPRPSPAATTKASSRSPAPSANPRAATSSRRKSTTMISAITVRAITLTRVAAECRDAGVADRCIMLMVRA